MTKGRILIVDDDETLAETLAHVLRGEGYDVDIAYDAESVLDRADMPFDVALVDIRLPGIDGIELVRRLRATDDRVDFVMITNHKSVETAVEAMRQGAVDYLTKPVSPPELLARLDRAFASRRLVGELARLQRELEGRHKFGSMIGGNRKMQEVYDLIASVSDTDASVLIQGETGTGKELVAKAIHFNSSRRAKPFVKVDCASLTATLLESELFGHVRGSFTGATRDREGRFRAADGGTIFLDEIGNVPLELQAKLLRVLQDREFEPVGDDRTVRVDVRVISASNEELAKLLAEGRFRQDLFYRINVVRVALPPLRERRDDVPILARHFLESCRERTGRSVRGFTPAAMRKLEGYDWPGNVRELENVVERAVILAGDEMIRTEDLPLGEEPIGAPDETEAATLRDAVDEAERCAILNALERTDWEKGAAAEALGISRASLYGKIKRHGIGRR